MAFPSAVFSGRSAQLWAQTGASPVPLTIAQLATWTGQVQNIVGQSAGGLGTDGTLVQVQSLVPIGSSAETVQFGQTGFIQADSIPVQNNVVQLALISTFIPTDTATQTVIADGLSGTIDRTYVVTVATGPVAAPTGIWAYAFNARVTGVQYDYTVNQEGRLTFTLVPRGNQYGISTPTP